MSEHSTGELITDQEIKGGQTLQDLTLSEPAAFAEARLEYRFISNANPVQVSQPAGPGAAQNTSTFDLQVMISNPGPAVPVLSISITFPLGTGDNQLSTALPPPTYDDKEWSIEPVAGEAGTIIIKPASDSTAPSPKPQMITEAIVFWLKGIRVNEAVGSVPITIDEFSPGHASARPVPPTIDKWPAEVPVINFKADPTILNEPDQQTTISWMVTQKGKGYDLRLFQITDGNESQIPDSVITVDDDGSASTSLTVETTSQFELRVFAADGTQITTFSADGSNRPLQLMVWVDVVRFNSARLVNLLGGRLVHLYWDFINAADCTLYITDEADNPLSQIDHLPSDTSVKGYLVTTGTVPGAKFKFSLTAHAKSGSFPAYYRDYPAVIVEPIVTISAGGPLQPMAATSDGRYVVTGGTYPLDSTVFRIDAATSEVVKIPVGNYPVGLAITPDGTTALVVNGYIRQNVSLIDIANKTVLANIPVTSNARHIAITPDGKFALVVHNGFDVITDGVDKCVSVINIPDKRVDRTIPAEWPVGIALASSPNGYKALVTTGDNTNARPVVWVIDLTTWVVDPNAIGIQQTADAGEIDSVIAVTPNSKLAFVSNGRTIQVIDIANHSALPVVIPCNFPQAIAFTPDGKLAFVLTYDSLEIINVADLQAPTVTVPLGTGQMVSLAVSEQANAVFVGNQTGLLKLSLMES